MLWDGEGQSLIGKAAGEFSDHIDMETLTPESCPNEISKLVGRQMLLKIDGKNSSGGRIVYSINSISENKRKIEKYAADEGSDFEGHNSDSDLELMFEQTTAVESNTPSDSPPNDDAITPAATPSKRLVEDDLFSPGVVTSTQTSTNKKLSGLKIEKL